MAGARPQGEHVVLFDDDHYYMGGVLAELLVSEGREVTLVTPAARVSEWADHTMEQERIQGRLIELGVELLTSKALLRRHAAGVRLGCAYTGRESELECDALLLVTSRLPNDALAQRWRRGREARCGRWATPQPGHDRGRRLGRAPLRGGAGRRAGRPGRGAVPARGGRAVLDQERDSTRPARGVRDHVDGARDQRHVEDAANGRRDVDQLEPSAACGQALRRR